MGEGRFYFDDERGPAIKARGRQTIHSRNREPSLTAGPRPEPVFTADELWQPEGYPAQAQPARAKRAPRAPRSEAARPMPTASVVHGLGAVLSLALIVGAGGWMWQLMQRDVAGVPVVRALEGPSRIAPADPGGRQAAHQGLSVNELAAAQDDAGPDQLVLAPPPVDLSLEDIMPARGSEDPSAQQAEAEPQPIPASLTQSLQAPDERSALGMNNPTRRAVAASPRPPSRSAGRSAQTRTASAAAVSQTVSSDAAAVNDALAASVAASVASGLGNLRNIDVDPASIGPGTRLVQLGAYDDPAAARAAWDQIARRFSPLLDDRGRVIEAAHSGGSVFYRLRAHGFEDERDARRFCAALVDQQVDCIPVLIR